MTVQVDHPSAAHALTTRIAQVLALDPEAPALEFDGSWHTWGQLAHTVERIAALVEVPGAEVGVLLRNRPASVGALLGVLQGGGCVVTVNPGRGRERTREDLAALDLPIVVGSPEDLAELLPQDARATRVEVDALGGDVVVRQGSDASPRAGRPEVAVRMLTSGTTGPPKRIDLGYDTLEQVLLGAKHYESATAPAAPSLRRGVALVNSPLVHLGGLFRVLQCVSDGRSFALLERFSVEGWVDAVRRHRPATSTLVPAALRMVLEADPNPEHLSSLRSVVSGTAPLDPADADEFHRRYGVPVLVSYAATEFGGGVAGWNVADHHEFWATKRGSVGRAHPGCELRVVDADSGALLADDEVGLLEVRARQIQAQGWVRTTDLARIDPDGFVWILGRADQAIIRGGFKVLPEDVRVALEQHPAVRGASVVAREDRRLGAVPVAAVELRPGVEGVGPEELIDFLSGRLSRYEVPTEVLVREHLPRTDSGKVDLGAVRALFDGAAAEG